jgi:hypothetical protein
VACFSVFGVTLFECGDPLPLLLVSLSLHSGPLQEKETSKAES